MIITRTKLPGVMHFSPDVYADDRGYFKETLNSHHAFEPKQVNMSVSKKGVIRGLHYQPGAAKLVWVVKGSIYDVAFDPISGKHHAVLLSDDNHGQLLVPETMAHGFQALENDTTVCYLMSDFYNAATEGGYNPLTVDIKWPMSKQIVSDKDKSAPNWKMYTWLSTSL